MLGRSPSCALLLFLFVGGMARGSENEEPTQGDLDAISERIAAARDALHRADSLVDRSERSRLQKSIRQVEKALERYERLKHRSEHSRKTSRLIYLAGAAVLSNDVTGVGVVDDALLPILALASLASHLATQRPVSDERLGRAWSEVVTTLEGFDEAQRLVLAKKSGKERASDIPSWAEGARMEAGETPAQAADRIMRRRYPDGTYPRGPRSEYNILKKHFERTR